MFQTSLGRPQPLGATLTAGGVNFSLFSENATKVELLLFQDPADLQPAQVVEIPAPTLPTVTDRNWYRAADTVLPSPNTFTPAGNEVAISTATYWANPQSVVILVSKAR
jgi:pullulanase/glycogen debranching enzyme